jgi:hypothetical protein
MMRVLECTKCGEAQRFDTWPDDGDEALDQIIRAESWTYVGDREICPTCSGGDDE